MPDSAEAKVYLERLALDLRNKAETYRMHAEGIRNRAARETLLALAADTDRMATSAEERARTLDATPSSAPGPSASGPLSEADR